MLNNKFQWNYAFRIAYDYLETFLAIGVVMETDTLIPQSSKVSPLSDFRGPELPQTASDLKGSTDRLGMSPKERGEGVNYDNSKHHATPSTTIGPLLVGSLVPDFQTEIRRKVRDTCLEVAEYLSATSICNPDEHKTMAFAIVMYARKQQQIQDYEYDIVISSENLMKYFRFTDLENTKSKCQTFMDYIEVNYRNGNFSSNPVIPKKKESCDINSSAEKPENIRLVNCLQLRPSYLSMNTSKLTAADLIDRRLTAIPQFKKDSDRTNSVLKLAPRLSQLLDKNSIIDEELDKAIKEPEIPTVEEKKEGWMTRGSIQVDSLQLDESPIESPTQIKDSVRLENLISFRNKPLENSNQSRGQERARSEQIKDVRHRSFNKDVSSPFEKSLHVNDSKEKNKISLHKFEIAEDSETSLNQNSGQVPENASMNQLINTRIMEKESPTLSYGRPPSSNTFSRISRDLNLKQTKPTSILIDLRDPTKLNHERRNDLIFPGQKLGVNLPSRLRYDNILHRPTDTVVRKFIEIGKRTHVAHTDLNRQSKLLSNPTDTLRQQLYSNSVVRQQLPNERKKPLGFNSGILSGTKHDDLLGRRGNLASSIRWPNKHH